MLNSFIVNLCIMITVVSLSFHIHRKAITFIEKHQAVKQVIVGIAGGLTGILLMKNSIAIEPAVIVDFRNMIVILSCFFGGPLSGFISALTIGILRMVITSFSSSAYAAVLSLLCIALGSSIIYRRALTFKRKWIASFFLNIIVSSTSMTTSLIQSPNLLKTLVYYSAGSFIMTIILYKILAYYMDFDRHYVWLTDVSTKDPLTGLNNVRAFDSELNKAVARCSRKNEQLAFLALDIDHFKKVNDIYGHLAGDEVIKGFANLLVDTCRSFDVISRNGGEEFTVILPDCPVQPAFVVAERIRKAAEEIEFAINNDASIHITVSIGIASFPDNTDNPDTLREYADRALYNAKESGRNKVVQYDHMNLIWKNDWLSGDTTIDDQHKALNEFANSIIDLTIRKADKKELSLLLERLQQYIVFHFEYEEKCLLEVNYPNQKEHTDIHENLVTEFVRLKDSYLAGRIMPSAFYAFIIDDVILAHIQNEDAKFFSYIKNRNQ